MTFALAAVFRPFVALGLIFLIAAPVKRLAERKLPEGYLRRILLFSWRV